MIKLITNKKKNKMKKKLTILIVALSLILVAFFIFGCEKQDNIVDSKDRDVISQTEMTADIVYWSNDTLYSEQYMITNADIVKNTLYLTLIDEPVKKISINDLIILSIYNE